MLGSRRSSQAGSHQFHLPSSVIVAGTRTIRTTVASRTIATAMPKPSCLTTVSASVAKPRKTTTMIAAAEEITRPVAARPRSTLAVASPVCSQNSRIRESRNTS